VAILAPIRFLWNATRGHRFRPWRSDYLRWRIETYSGMKAETLTLRIIVGFAWQEKWRLLKFLFWTGKIDALARGSLKAKY
jgi:hypothetical protein